MKKLVCLHKHLHIVTGLLCVIALFITNTVYAQSNGIVGSLGGDASVNPMGMATYSIPIDVVPGTKGIQPNLAIVYNSSSGRGYLGCNWHLSGISSITRVQRTQYPDGSIGTVNLDGNDRYALDGAKLMKLSGGDYATTNAKYGTEIENFTRVTLKGTPNDVSQYFVAVTDQGEIIEYGNTDDSKQKTTNNKIVSWMVNKITDADGNFMTISYGQSTSNGEIWPTEINYTGNTAAGLSTYAKVIFQYTTDSNINTTYIGGKIIRPTKLLNKILVKYGNELVRQYDFNYTTDRSTRLNAVILKDASGEELTRTTIGWGNDATSNTIKTYNSLVGYVVCIGDYNGDNLPDLFLNSYDSNSNVTSWQIRLGDGTGNFNSVSYSSTLNGYYQFSTIDTDGSGKDGIGFITANSNNNGYSYKVIKLTNNSHTITTKATNVNSKFHIGDFLGQGGVQFLCESNPSNNYITLTSSDFNASITVHKDSKISVTDFNGNGKSDIHVVRGTTVDIYEYNESSASFVKILDSGTLAFGSAKDYFGDINGDGKQDYIHFKSPNWYLKMSKGNAYTDDITLPFNYSTSSSGEPSYPIFVFDFNGDGKDDIIQPVHDYNTNETTLNIYYSQGYDNGTYNYELQYEQNNGIYHWEDAHYRFGDLDCDGKVDILYIGAIQHAPVLVSSKEKRKHDLVCSFTNGLGKCSTLEYSYFNSPNIGYFGSEGRRVIYPLVSKLREPNGIGGNTETTFIYGYTVFDYDRRQLMGFGLIDTYCNGTNTKIEYEFNDMYHHLNLKKSLTYYLQRGNNTEGGYIGDTSYWVDNRTDDIYHYKLENELAYLNLQYTRFFPYNLCSSFTNNLKDAIQTTCSWLNQEGRIEKVSVIHKKAKPVNSQWIWLSCDSTSYTYTNVTLHNGKTVKKIASDTIWHKRNGFSQKPYQCTIYGYSSEGRLSTISVSDSDGAIGTTSYSYNSYGFPISETYTPNGMSARTRSFGYSNNYRFLTQETDELGHTQSAIFDNKTGLMTSQTDVNGLTTTYQYDAFGRLTEVLRPDRTEQHISYNWNNYSDFSNAVYYTNVTEAGQPTAKTFYDNLGRAIHTYVEGRGYDDVVYNDLGLVSKTTYVPYTSINTSSGNKTWHTNIYDNYNRIVSEVDPYTDLSYSYYDYHGSTEHEFFVTVSDHIRNTQQTKKYDALGRLTQVTDEGGTINYSYSYQTERDKIRDKMSVSVGGSITNIISDIRGNRISIEDPDAGTITSTYNVLNQLTSRTDANLNQTAYTYDLIGRTTQIVYSKGTASETIAYTYDNATGSGIGKLATVKKNGSNDCVYVYDDFGRPSEIRFGVAGYKQQYAYNDLGQLQYFTYPDSYCIENVYNTYGELKQIRDATTDTLIYAVDTRNKFRQPLKCRYGNETGVEYSYNAYGMLTGIKNGNVVGKTIINGGGTGSVAEEDVSYSINNQYRQLTYTYNDRGFIGSRSDAKVSQSETYTYDDLDRLTSYKVNGVTAASFTYGNTGNILTNSKVGTYSYGNSKPHAVTGIHGDYTCPISTSQCDVTYNLRNKPASIAENGYSITFDYNAAGMRRYTRYYQGNAMKKATARISDVHEMETATGLNRKLDYIYAEGQIVAVHVKNGMTDSLYYVMTDHLGSWNKVMDKDKNIVQQTHFDPWGNRMSYTAWNTPQTQTSFTFRRGFTGHEHYDRFKIINANARLYDPVIGRFFSPDPFVQAPDFTQNYNRYSYCLNNPVMYRDPKGEVFVIDDIIAAATIGAIINSFTQIVAGNVNNVGDFFVAAGIGALSGAVGLAVGSGVNAAIAGGSFASGFVGTATVSSTGFIAGAGTGAASGFASGFITGTGNSLLAGNSFGQSLQNGWTEGVIGLGTGGLIGGIGGGIDAISNYRDFWTGNAKQYDISPAYYASIDGGNEMFLNADDYTVINNSDYVAYYKPEDGKYGVGEYKIDPHKGIKVNVDGLATCKYTDKVYKVPGKYGYHPRPIIANSGEVYFSKSNRVLLKGISLTGYSFGWMTLDQLDPSWENLFRSALLIK